MTHKHKHVGQPYHEEHTGRIRPTFAHTSIDKNRFPHPHRTKSVEILCARERWPPLSLINYGIAAYISINYYYFMYCLSRNQRFGQTISPIRKSHAKRSNIQIECGKLCAFKVASAMLKFGVFVQPSFQPPLIRACRLPRTRPYLQRTRKNC